MAFYCNLHSSSVNSVIINDVKKQLSSFTRSLINSIASDTCPCRPLSTCVKKCHRHKASREHVKFIRVPF